MAKLEVGCLSLCVAHDDAVLGTSHTGFSSFCQASLIIMLRTKCAGLFISLGS